MGRDRVIVDQPLLLLNAAISAVFERCFWGVYLPSVFHALCIDNILTQYMPSCHPSHVALDNKRKYP